MRTAALQFRVGIMGVIVAKADSQTHQEQDHVSVIKNFAPFDGVSMYWYGS